MIDVQNGNVIMSYTYSFFISNDRDGNVYANALHVDIMMLEIGGFIRD